MGLRSNFKFHECDKRTMFRKVYPVVARIAGNYDLLDNGRPKILLQNDRGERLSSDSVARQIEAVAYHAREAMVRTCLDVCGFLSQPKEDTKLLVNGCFFLKTAIYDVWTKIHNFPENPDFDGDLEEEPQRPPSFYDASFWASSVVQSWLVVHTVYEWYELRMKAWARLEADKLVNSWP